ncbi:AI-2E family transporter [Flavobacterium luteum]|uniref:AI-2E family transporter n=1 Tax=Flavobacterium luteum TaxID=2026654 RepID=A0A7J5AJB0_9FLAO|nr:AI-2E family transporter [Flavobacterium luteum]KAB1157590.1 AI-2E family transporter [Flavobacterium luteum]
MKEILKIENQVNPKRKLSLLEILQYIVFLTVILYFGRTLFIPLSFSLFISFILYPECKWLEKKGIRKTGAIAISLFGLSILIFLVSYLLFLQIASFSNEWHSLSTKIVESVKQLGNYVEEQFGMNSEKQLTFIKNFTNNFEIFPLLKNATYSLSETAFNLILIPILSALLLYYRHLLSAVLYQLFPRYKKEAIHEILIETIHEYYNFIKGMGLVYLIVGTLNAIGLAIIGVPHPILFGFIASILTFIPYFGIIISSLLPIAVSWITFNSIWYPIGVIVVFTIVQLLEAYIIFPFAVGNRLKINTLVIIVIIIMGGILWGAAGMIVFIPFISIVKLIADRTESLKILSLLLSNGNDSKNIN